MVSFIFLACSLVFHNFPCFSIGFPSCSLFFIGFPAFSSRFPCFPLVLLDFLHFSSDWASHESGSCYRYNEKLEVPSPSQTSRMKYVETTILRYHSGLWNLGSSSCLKSTFLKPFPKDDTHLWQSRRWKLRPLPNPISAPLSQEHAVFSGSLCASFLPRDLVRHRANTSENCGLPSNTAKYSKNLKEFFFLPAGSEISRHVRCFLYGRSSASQTLRSRVDSKIQESKNNQNGTKTPLRGLTALGLPSPPSAHSCHPVVGLWCFRVTLELHRTCRTRTFAHFGVISFDDFHGKWVESQLLKSSACPPIFLLWIYHDIAMLLFRQTAYHFELQHHPAGSPNTLFAALAPIALSVQVHARCLAGKHSKDQIPELIQKM